MLVTFEDRIQLMLFVWLHVSVNLTCDGAHPSADPTDNMWPTFWDVCSRSLAARHATPAVQKTTPTFFKDCVWADQNLCKLCIFILLHHERSWEAVNTLRLIAKHEMQKIWSQQTDKELRNPPGFNYNQYTKIMWQDKNWDLECTRFCFRSK